MKNSKPETAETQHCPREQDSLCIWPDCGYPARCLLPNFVSRQRTQDALREEDKRKVREALKVLDGMTGNRGDDEFVWDAQAAFERLMNERRQKQS